MNDLQIGTIVQDHAEWVITKGVCGKQANFSGCIFKGVDFGGLELRDSFFAGCKIENCFFVGSNLDGASFTSSFISNSIFSSSSAKNSKYHAAELFNCFFGEMNINSPGLEWIFRILKNVKFKSSYLKPSNLSDSQFGGVLIKNCCMKGIKADGINLNGSISIKTNYENCLMNNSTAKKSSFIECSLKDSDIFNSDWSQSSFEKTDITGINLGSFTKTDGAFFHTAFLSVSDAFCNAKLQERIFS